MHCRKAWRGAQRILQHMANCTQPCSTCCKPSTRLMLFDVHTGGAQSACVAQSMLTMLLSAKHIAAHLLQHVQAWQSTNGTLGTTIHIRQRELRQTALTCKSRPRQVPTDEECATFLLAAGSGARGSKKRHVCHLQHSAKHQSSHQSMPLMAASKACALSRREHANGALRHALDIGQR